MDVLQVSARRSATSSTASTSRSSRSGGRSVEHVEEQVERRAGPCWWSSTRSTCPTPRARRTSSQHVEVHRRASTRSTSRDAHMGYFHNQGYYARRRRRLRRRASPATAPRDPALLPPYVEFVKTATPRRANGRVARGVARLAAAAPRARARRQPVPALQGALRKRPRMAAARRHRRASTSTRSRRCASTARASSWQELTSTGWPPTAAGPRCHDPMRSAHLGDRQGVPVPARPRDGPRQAARPVAIRHNGRVLARGNAFAPGASSLTLANYDEQ